jgi:hypothetical protein
MRWRRRPTACDPDSTSTSPRQAQTTGSPDDHVLVAAADGRRDHCEGYLVRSAPPPGTIHGMDIAITGAGTLGRALASSFVRAGHRRRAGQVHDRGSRRLDRPGNIAQPSAGLTGGSGEPRRPSPLPGVSTAAQSALVSTVVVLPGGNSRTALRLVRASTPGIGSAKNGSQTPPHRRPATTAIRRRPARHLSHVRAWS